MIVQDHNISLGLISVSLPSKDKQLLRHINLDTKYLRSNITFKVLIQ